MQTEIQLQGLEFFGNHGLYPEEKRLGNRFRVDVRIMIEVPFVGENLNMEDTIDYALIYGEVKAEMEQACTLLEILGQRIIQRVTARFPELLQVDVAIAKANPAFGGLCDWVRVNSHWEKS